MSSEPVDRQGESPGDERFRGLFTDLDLVARVRAGQALSVNEIASPAVLDALTNAVKVRALRVEQIFVEPYHDRDFTASTREHIRARMRHARRDADMIEHRCARPRNAARPRARASLGSGRPARRRTRATRAGPDDDDPEAGPPPALGGRASIGGAA
jgi:hypothetical protein